MILADTSVWIDFLRHGNGHFSEQLAQDQIVIHPSIVGELACGNLKNRQSILADLQALRSVQLATDSEVLAAIEQHKLWGRGVGWLDTHLLVSAILSQCRFHTIDKRLAAVARQLGIR